MTAEDSVAPVKCNGKATPDAARPFLLPPYHGWVSMATYFDHDSPNFVRDGTIVTTTGTQAQIDAVHQAPYFPAYWNPSLRQYLYYDGHNGYDYNAWYQPLYAAAAGKVIFAAFEYPSLPARGYGRMVMIEHPHGYVTLYGHLSRLLVRSGERVRRGQRIGISGNSGYSSGPHLHFSVFHNCTPTDPCGWNGSGPDPLASFRNETSTWLWIRQPPITNPLPDWPRLSSLKSPPGERILLLRLPSKARSANTFGSQLAAESELTIQSLLSHGVDVRTDYLRGAIDIEGPITAQQIYRLQDVASIATPDTLVGEKTDVLRALARSALVSTRHSNFLDGSRRWTGFLLRWQGRVLLIGKGTRGESVDLRLGSGHGGPSYVVRTDPQTGAYVIDLGSLSGSEFARLQRGMSARSARKPVVTLRRLPRITARAPHHGAGSVNGSGDWESRAVVMAVIATLLLGGSGRVFFLRRRRNPATS